MKIFYQISIGIPIIMVDQVCMISNSNTFLNHYRSPNNGCKSSKSYLSGNFHACRASIQRVNERSAFGGFSKRPSLAWTGLRLAAYLAARAEQSRRKWDEEERDEDSRHPHSPSDWITLMYPSCVALSVRVAQKSWKDQKKSHVNWTDDTVKSWEPWKPREASGVALSEIRGKMALMPRVSN